MKHTESVIQSDPEIMGGTPVFVGTRAPFQTLLDYLEAGQSLAEFLDDFPAVSRDQARSNSIDDLRPLAPQILGALAKAGRGVTLVGG